MADVLPGDDQTTTDPRDPDRVPPSRGSGAQAGRRAVRGTAVALVLGAASALGWGPSGVEPAVAAIEGPAPRASWDCKAYPNRGNRVCRRVLVRGSVCPSRSASLVSRGRGLIVLWRTTFPATAESAQVAEQAAQRNLARLKREEGQGIDPFGVLFAEPPTGVGSHVVDPYAWRDHRRSTRTLRVRLPNVSGVTQGIAIEYFGRPAGRPRVRCAGNP